MTTQTTDIAILKTECFERGGLKGTTTKQIAALLQSAATPEHATALAYSAAARMFMHAPAKPSLAHIRTFIEKNVPVGLIESTTLDDIVQHFEKLLERRKTSALAHVTIPQRILERHQSEKCDELPNLSAADYHGVIVLWAPMGSGKTRTVGRPFVRHCVEHTSTKPLAICHRVSLVHDMAKALGIEHYGEIDASMVNGPKIRGLATCLPSITRKIHQPLIDQAEYIFIDEISQVLRFLSAKDHCRTNEANNEKVYDRLRELVANAKCVMVADAGCDARTISFLESCRPGEKFRIVEMRAKPKGINATYHSGSEAAAAVVGDCLAELAVGGHVWIATESADRARNLGAFFSSRGYRVMSVFANNKGNAEQAAFLAEPERLSRGYDVVIASPVIGSGLSIEHKETGEWFTLGAFIGGGRQITPADAIQALCRVRYLRRFSLGLLPSSEIGKQSSKSIKAAWLEASVLEGAQGIANAFTDFVADVIASDQNARADFAAGLLWQLERAEWTLAQHDTVDSKIVTKLASACKAQDLAHRTALLAAPTIGHEAARRLESSANRTEPENIMLEAHRVRNALNVPYLDEATLDFWDNGAAVGRLDRYSAWKGVILSYDDTAENPARRMYWRAMVVAYNDLLAGFDPHCTRVTEEIANRILDRMLARRHLLAHLGIVSKKYGAWKEGKDGQPVDLPRPKNPRQELANVLARMGLAWRSIRARVSIPGVTTLEKMTKGGYKMGRVYVVSHYSLSKMQASAQLRNAGRNTKQVYCAAKQAGDFPRPCAGLLTFTQRPSRIRICYDVGTPPPALGAWTLERFFRDSLGETNQSEILAISSAIWRAE
jgi:putative DNA primase/helicase